MSNITINAEGRYYRHSYTITNDDTKQLICVIYYDQTIDKNGISAYFMRDILDACGCNVTLNYKEEIRK